MSKELEQLRPFVPPEHAHAVKVWGDDVMRAIPEKEYEALPWHRQAAWIFERLLELKDQAEDDAQHGWLCPCGHYEPTGFHCEVCGNEPTEGCPCDMCQSRFTVTEGDDEYCDPPEGLCDSHLPAPPEGGDDRGPGAGDQLPA